SGSAETSAGTPSRNAKPAEHRVSHLPRRRMRSKRALPQSAGSTASATAGTPGAAAARPAPRRGTAGGSCRRSTTRTTPAPRRSSGSRGTWRGSSGRGAWGADAGRTSPRAGRRGSEPPHPPRGTIEDSKHTAEDAKHWDGLAAELWEAAGPAACDEASAISSRTSASEGSAGLLDRAFARRRRFGRSASGDGGSAGSLRSPRGERPGAKAGGELIGDKPEAATVPVVTPDRQPGKQAENRDGSVSSRRGPTCLRSGKVEMRCFRQTSEGRRQYAVPLLLQLWDVPLADDFDSSDEEDPIREKAANGDSAGEIAGMFRFAQHVTLCPDPAGGADLDGLVSDLASLIDETAPDRVHNLNDSAADDESSDGTERDLAADEAADLSLGHALQCALNLAAAETDCRLPVFGVWRPNGPSLLGESRRPDGRDEFHDSLEHGDGEGPEPPALVALRPPAVCGRLRADGGHALSCALHALPVGPAPRHLSTVNGLSRALVGRCGGGGIWGRDSPRRASRGRGTSTRGGATTAAGRGAIRRPVNLRDRIPRKMKTALWRSTVSGAGRRPSRYFVRRRRRRSSSRTSGALSRARCFRYGPPSRGARTVQRQQRRRRASRDHAGPPPQDPLGRTVLAVQAPRRRAGVPDGTPRPPLPVGLVRRVGALRP
ncbi:hypothetical protein THAOC_04776, partial [Thalassiosira oceanica]